jgi:hypothetical protein
MRAYLMAGIVILVLGAFVLLRGANVTSRRDVLHMGDMTITAEEQQTIPPWVGGAAMSRGIVADRGGSAEAKRA